jgi:DNA repair exonuclease SbcCD ATPase subunit
MDDERRKDKDTIAFLENRIMSLEGSITAAQQQIKDLSGEITRLNTVVTRMDQYDTTLIQQRVEAKHHVEEVDKEIKKREEEAEKVRRVEIKALDASIAETRRELEILPRLEKAIQARIEEDSRLGRFIDEVRVNIETVRHSEEEYIRTFRLLEDGRRQDNKRLNDLVGEVTAVRKRVDDQRGQVELLSNSIRKLETRLTELVSVEAERRDTLANFLDKQALTQVERDRTWKEWQARFEIIEKQAADAESQLQRLETTHRETKRSQQLLEEVSQKVERRLGEITEIQRLSEERFRQEWVTFKADDQKRWTNYTLVQEEQRSEGARQNEKITDRITQLEDGLQEEQDILQQITEQTQKRLQTLLSLVHEWVESYERSAGRG